VHHPGRLLRSDNLQDLTARDAETLLGLGLSDIVDLRSDFEIEQVPPGSPAIRGCVSTPTRCFANGVPAWEDKPEERPSAACGGAAVGRHGTGSQSGR
jgi:hypothetical protein